MQVSLRVELAEVTGAQPAIHDRLGGKLRLVEIAGHDCLAADVHFTDAILTGVDDLDFHARKRLANGVRAKWLEIVHGDSRAGLGEAVAIGDGDAEIVEKLQRLWFGERASHDDGPEFAAKCRMNLFQKAATEPEARLALRERLVHRNEEVKNFSFASRKFGETDFQAFLKILQDERNEAD